MDSVGRRTCTGPTCKNGKDNKNLYARRGAPQSPTFFDALDFDDFDEVKTGIRSESKLKRDVTPALKEQMDFIPKGSRSAKKLTRNKEGVRALQTAKGYKLIFKTGGGKGIRNGTPEKAAARSSNTKRNAKLHVRDTKMAKKKSI